MSIYANQPTQTHRLSYVFVPHETGDFVFLITVDKLTGLHALDKFVSSPDNTHTGARSSITFECASTQLVHLNCTYSSL